MLKQKPINKYKCVICRSPAAFYVGNKKVCSDECRTKLIQITLEKAVTNRQKLERKENKKRKRELDETIPKLTKEAQKEFNRYIRARDHGKPCISCGKPFASGLGGLFDCGHYRSVGAAKHMRFNPLNAHGQCVHCNRDLSGNIVEYRKWLINKIGVNLVESIENNNNIKKWTKDELKRIKLVFRRKAKHYERNQSS